MTGPVYTLPFSFKLVEGVGCLLTIYYHLPCDSRLSRFFDRNRLRNIEPQENLKPQILGLVRCRQILASDPGLVITIPLCIIGISVRLLGDLISTWIFSPGSPKVELVIHLHLSNLVRSRAGKCSLGNIVSSVTFERGMLVPGNTIATSSAIRTGFAKSSHDFAMAL